MNSKEVRRLSGLTQEQIARTLELTLNGWQKKEARSNTKITIDLKVNEHEVAQLIRGAYAAQTSLSDFLSGILKHHSPPVQIDGG